MTIPQPLRVKDMLRVLKNVPKDFPIFFAGGEPLVALYEETDHLVVADRDASEENEEMTWRDEMRRDYYASVRLV